MGIMEERLDMDITDQDITGMVPDIHKEYMFMVDIMADITNMADIIMGFIDKMENNKKALKEFSAFVYDQLQSTTLNFLDSETY